MYALFDVHRTNNLSIHSTFSSILRCMEEMLPCFLRKQDITPHTLVGDFSILLDSCTSILLLLLLSHKSMPRECSRAKNMLLYCRCLRKYTPGMLVLFQQMFKSNIWLIGEEFMRRKNNSLESSPGKSYFPSFYIVWKSGNVNIFWWNLIRSHNFLLFFLLKDCSEIIIIPPTVSIFFLVSFGFFIIMMMNESITIHVNRLIILLSVSFFQIFFFTSLTFHFLTSGEPPMTQAFSLIIAKRRWSR